MSGRMVAIPERTAHDLLRLVDKAIVLADRAEQQGQPIPKQNYDAMCRLYADLDRAITGNTGNLTRFPQRNGATRS